MPKNDRRNNEIRAYMAEHSISYTRAMRELDGGVTRPQLTAAARTVIETAQIGGPLYLPPFPGATYLRGPDALESVRVDLYELQTRSAKIIGERTAELVVAYHEAVCALLDLNPEIVLRARPHIHEARAQGFLLDTGRIEMSHRFAVPHRPGGFLDFQLDFVYDHSAITLGPECCTNSFEGDARNRHDQDLETDAEDARRAGALGRYIAAVCLGAINGAAWKSADAAGIERGARIGYLAHTRMLTTS